MVLAKDSITIEYDSSVAILSFNRPQVLNAFDNELMESTISKVNELNKNEAVRVIVVRGEGRAFSPGFDLKQPLTGKCEMSGIGRNSYNFNSIL